MSVLRVRARTTINKHSYLFLTEDDEVVIGFSSEEEEIHLCIAQSKDGLNELIKAAQTILAATSPNAQH